MSLVLASCDDPCPPSKYPQTVDYLQCRKDVDEDAANAAAIAATITAANVTVIAQ